MLSLSNDPFSIIKGIIEKNVCLQDIQQPIKLEYKHSSVFLLKYTTSVTMRQAENLSLFHSSKENLGLVLFRVQPETKQ